MRIFLTTILVAFCLPMLFVQGTFAQGQSPTDIADETLVQLDNFFGSGETIIENLDDLFLNGRTASLMANGESPLLGLYLQTGTIQPTSKLTLVEKKDTGAVFEITAVQGANPAAGGKSVHVIHTSKGMIFAQSKMLITLELNTKQERALVFVHAEFNVTGGTDGFENAGGSFQMDVKARGPLLLNAVRGHWVQRGSLLFD